jgi:hypothetical protein
VFVFNGLAGGSTPPDKSLISLWKSKSFDINGLAGEVKVGWWWGDLVGFGAVRIRDIMLNVFVQCYQ